MNFSLIISTTNNGTQLILLDFFTVPALFAGLQCIICLTLTEINYHPH